MKKQDARNNQNCFQKFYFEIIFFFKGIEQLLMREVNKVKNICKLFYKIL